MLFSNYADELIIAVDYGNRATGRTHAALHGLLNNPNAIFVVRDRQHALSLTRQYGVMNKIVLYQELPTRLNGVHAPVILDHTVLGQIIHDAREEIVYNRVQHEKAVKSNEKLRKLNSVVLNFITAISKKWWLFGVQKEAIKLLSELDKGE